MSQCGADNGLRLEIDLRSWSGWGSKVVIRESEMYNQACDLMIEPCVDIEEEVEYMILGYPMFKANTVIFNSN